MVARRILAAVAAVLAIGGLASAGYATAQPVSNHPVTHRTLATLSAAERAAVRRAAPRPPRVTNLAPYQDGSAVTLGWHNPNSALFTRVLVRYARGSTPPASPSSGSAVQLRSRRASTATLSGLRPDVKYAAAVWTRDADNRLSQRTATSFITPAVHRGGLATISGTITDDTGQPLSGAVVTADNWQADTGPLSTVTDSDGRYQLAVPAAKYFIGIDGSNAVGGAHDATGYLGNGRLATLSPHQHLTLDPALGPAAAMTGTVTDGLGNPVGGVAVYGTPAYPYVPSDVGDFRIIEEFLDGQTTTGPDGTFVLKGLYPDVTQACFDPSTSGHLSTSPSRFGYYLQCEDTPHSVHVGQVIDTGKTALHVGPMGGTLTGAVTSPTGNGIGGVAVSVGPVGRRLVIGYATTDDTGRYSISGLRTGTYRVCADTSAVSSSSTLGYVSRCDTRHVTVELGKTSRAHVVVPPGGAFSGVVRAPNGSAVRNAWIWLVAKNSEEEMALTDNHGRFNVSGLRSGRYRACVDTTSTRVRGYPNGLSSECYHHRSRFVVRRGKDRIGIDFALRPGAAIRGTVIAGSGHPVHRADVYTNFANGHLTDIGTDAYAVTGPRGHFKLLGLRPGTYQLCYDNGTLVGEPRGRCFRRNVQTRPGKVANYGTIDMGPSGSIHALVTDPSGHLLNGVDVAALTPCHGFDCDRSPLFGQRYRVAASWTTYRNGTVTLPDLKPGNYAVCMFGYLAAPRRGPTPLPGYADRCVSNSFDVVVQANKTASVTTALPLAGEVTGTVTDTKGHPVQNVLVKITHSAAADVTTDPFFFGISPPGQAAYTAADGTFAVRSVAAGEQTVCFDAAQARERIGLENQCYGGQPGKKGGTPVSVTAGAVTTGVNISLTQLGRITGSVTTADGKALPKRTSVFIFRPGHPRSALIGGPAPDGSYRTPGIKLGNYVVCFDAPHYSGQCYDDVPWNGFDGTPLPSDATQVTVSAGTTASGIDAVLAPQ